MFLTTIKSGLFFIAFSLVLLSCQKSTLPARHTIDLSGAWQFSLDQADVGIQEKWYVTDLPDVIELPGTTDTRGKGFLNQDSSTMHLNRVYRYEGAAWYRKEITIPAEFRDQVVRLIIERTKSSQVWIDDHFVGESHLLQSPQKYDVSTYLSPGEHSITLRIDNSLKLTPYGNVHIYTDETQTNWNGVIGKFVLEAAPKTHIADLQIFPDIDRRNIHIQLTLINGLGLAAVDLELQVRRTENGKNKTLKSIHQTVPCDSILHLDYALGDDMKLWDDYQQPLYHLTAVISQGTLHDSKTVPFGMRRFTAAGKQFAINGRTTFLRGKHDGCVFPITGHPPMDADGWIRVFKIARSYGINHYRFHSYCPPEAAFTAADQLGLFLQPELPFWGYLESDTVAARLKAEAVAMLKSYANHPSLVMFGAGNEIGGGYERVEKIITDLKDIDPRPLYTFGSNNSIGYVGPSAGSDFHIAARTPFAHDTTLTHTRLTHAFVDSKDGGILNTQMPSTMVNFDYAVAQIKTPLISHEMGQYQIYPDYQEIEKYTGVLRAWNLEIFRNRLKKTDMLDQNAAFTRASGAWAALCYKAEMEAALRTAEMAGFQLLDLQDYPGQGTALVGILDAFMDSKNVISRESWLQSCNDVVLLLQFPKYCWQVDEVFQAEVKAANYSRQTINDDLIWQVVDRQGRIVDGGTMKSLKLTNGGLTIVGEISMALSMMSSAERLTINVALKKSGYSNSYPLWVYPAPNKNVVVQEISVAEKWDETVEARLLQGAKVLLFPSDESIQAKSVAGLFPPDFWNYGMFKGISEWAKKPVSPGTLGILTDPEHPIFNDFPTDPHTNWQWWSIIKASRPLELDQTSPAYRPIVQVIDNLERNHKFGLIFEFSVGKGSLLVCTARLKEILDRPEAYQLYQSMINYMQSDDFTPDYIVAPSLLKKLL